VAVAGKVPGGVAPQKHSPFTAPQPIGLLSLRVRGGPFELHGESETEVTFSPKDPHFRHLPQPSVAAWPHTCR